MRQLSPTLTLQVAFGATWKGKVALPSKLPSDSFPCPPLRGKGGVGKATPLTLPPSCPYPKGEATWRGVKGRILGGGVREG